MDIIALLAGSFGVDGGQVRSESAEVRIDRFDARQLEPSSVAGGMLIPSCGIAK
jgi:hypothetical protein